MPIYVYPWTAKWTGQVNISPTMLKILAQVLQFMHLLNLIPPYQLTSSMCLSGKTYLARENEHENLQ